VLRDGALLRPRLLARLVGRWDKRLVLVTGGAGLGKTTLLAQALADNALAPRGFDAWLGAAPADVDARHLCAGLLEALGATVPSEATPAAVADAVWALAPTQVSLVIDDAHVITANSSAALAITELLDTMPANGHLVLASRTRPAFAVARLVAHGDVIEVSEHALRFDDDEQAAFARLRSVAPDVVSAAGGWPALAALRVESSTSVGDDFLWEEVLRSLDGDQRAALSVLCDLGGGDNDLVSVTLGRDIDLGLLSDVPLLARTPDDWIEPHPLWKPVAAGRLALDDRAATRARGVARLIERDRLSEAFDLIASMDLWDQAPALLRHACLMGARPSAGELRRWLDRCPPEMLSTPGGLLAEAVHALMVTPAAAIDALRTAIAACRAVGDDDGEIAAVAHLGRIALWHQDLASIVEFAPRVSGLAAAGNEAARGLERLGLAMYHDMNSNDAGVLEALSGIPKDALDAPWQAVASWYRSVALHTLGDPTAALASIEAGVAQADPVLALTLAYSRHLSLWALGRIEEVENTASELRAATVAAGVTHNITGGFADGSREASHLGHDDEAAGRLRRARDSLQPNQANAAVRIALADASLRVLRGDEEGARAVLVGALADYPLETGPPRRAWRDALALTYVMVADARAEWDRTELPGIWSRVRDYAAAVVAGREPIGGDPLDRLDLADLDVVRAALPLPFAAELAVRLHARGRPEGAALLDRLGAAGRDATRALTETRPSARGDARSLLAAVPPQPRVRVEIAVLGPIEIRHDGVAVMHEAARRERVRALLAFLHATRSTSREIVAAALWPDLEERAAANNLRVNLSYLLQALEPWRADGDPSYFVRTSGTRLQFVAASDADDFDRNIAMARAAEEAGLVSVALDHHLAAVAVYRGQLYEDLDEAQWFGLAREHYAGQCRASAVRAAQLLSAANDTDRAGELARRALELDPWCEAAYAVLIAGALARDDRRGAVRLLRECVAVLNDLGVEPSLEIAALERRIPSP
jgi:DNA-binding SARP family transcriptional activator